MEKFNEFKERVLHKKDDLFAILFLNPITIRLAYLIKKYNLNITPNQITLTRLVILAPLIILCLFLAPLLGFKIFYLIAVFLSYLFLLSDWLDGQLARGSNTVSYKGILFDSIADRWCTIILFVFLFSIGLWFNIVIIIYSAVFLFVLKTFHLMIITKIFYYGTKVSYLGKMYSSKAKTTNEIFAGEDAKKILGLTTLESFFKKINSFLKIKKWSCAIGGSERYFFSIMLPLQLLILNLNIVVIIFAYVLIISYSISFVVRIKNLLQ